MHKNPIHWPTFTFSEIQVHSSYSVYKVLDLLRSFDSFEEGDGKGFPDI
jgi:hypothetical protein